MSMCLMAKTGASVRRCRPVGKREPKPDLSMGSGSKRGAVGRKTDDTCREYGGMKRQ